MSTDIKRQLKDKARYTYGLVSVLRKDASDCNLNKLRESIHEADITLRKLMFVVGEMEYILKLNDAEGP